MHVVAEPIQRLIDALSQLPGIGPKSASRLAFYLLRAPGEQVQELAGAIGELKAGIVYCGRCQNLATSDPCAICADATRDASLICVVEEPLDVVAIERTGAFHGYYHVLHGVINPVEGIGPDDLRIASLLARGLPVGGDLEYADEVTLSRALEGRRDL